MRLLSDERGLTLAEMMVAMAVSSVLLMAVVSASLFMQRYLSGWQKQDLLSEELVFVTTELEKAIASAERIDAFGDSLRVTNADKSTVYRWNTSVFRKGNHRLSHSEVTLDSIAVCEKPLPVGLADSILVGGDIRRGFYSVFIKVSYKHKITDSLQVLVRNNHDYVRDAL